MYIAVCDDNTEELQHLTDLLVQWQHVHQTTLRFKTFPSGTELLAAAEKEAFSLYLLDVMMPGTDGMTVAREIRTFDDTAEIVFLTASPSFAYESYSVHALDYLLKPIRSELLFPILDRLFLQEQHPKEGLLLKCGAQLIRVPFSYLTYVEVNGKHLYFSMTDGSEREVYGSLNEYGPLLLCRPEFIQIHRSYIINMLQIKDMSPSGIHTFSGKTLPVSRRIYPQLQQEYIKLLFVDREH